MHPMLRRAWPAFLSAVLVLLSFPPFNLGLLVFVALVPWLLFLRECDGRRAFRSGMLFGFLFWLGEFSFVAKFVEHWTGSLALGLVPYLIGCFIGSFYFAIFGWIANLCYQRRIVWAVPIVWAGVEVLRSYLFGLAFPFGLLATPLTPLPAIIQTAHFGTVYLTSAWVALANVTIAELMTGKGYLPMRWYAFAFIALLGVSLVRYSQPEPGSFRVLAAGQPGVDMAFGGYSDLDQRLAAAIDDIEAHAKGVDLLVLPEGMVRAGPRPPPPVLFHVDKSLPIVFGGQRGVNPAHQSAFSYDGHWEVADKTRLVIFGEYVPFRHALPFLDKFNLPGGDLVPGDQVTTMKVGQFRVGAALCFEALFPDVPYRQALDGANVIAVMSIDDWYFGTNAPPQLRDAANWRAIETGAPVVRAASLGYSMIVDARGRTVAEAPLRERNALAARVRVPERADLFPLLPVFPYLSVLFLVGLPIDDGVRRRIERAWP